MDARRTIRGRIDPRNPRLLLVLLSVFILHVRIGQQRCLLHSGELRSLVAACWTVDRGPAGRQR